MKGVARGFNNTLILDSEINYNLYKLITDSLEEMYGKDVAHLVDGVTKLQHFDMNGTGNAVPAKAVDKLDVIPVTHTVSDVLPIVSFPISLLYRR